MEGQTMKRTLTIFATVLLAFSLIFAANSQATDYEAFSKNLVKAVKADNQGLQVSALQQVIKYGNKVEVKDATLDIVRIYRRSNNEQFRQLALAAINAMESEWALGIVKRDYQFEANPKIKRMMAAVLNANKEKAGISVSAQ